MTSKPTHRTALFFRRMAGILFGSSYLTGASNLFRFDLETKKLDALSNSETGLFRPVLLPDGTLSRLRVFLERIPAGESAGSSQSRT